MVILSAFMVILSAFSNLNDLKILLMLEEDKEAGNGGEINEMVGDEERVDHK